MADQAGSKFKNYFLNTFIIIFALLCLILLYNFVYRSLSKPSQTRDIIITDSSKTLTRQPNNQTLQLDVQNGSGSQGIANKFTDFLRSNGYDVVEMGNFSASDIKNSFVIDRAGNMRNAKRVASALGINEKYVIQQINKEYFLDATVVVGRDYNDLKPFKEIR